MAEISAVPSAVESSDCHEALLKKFWIIKCCLLMCLVDS